MVGLATERFAARRRTNAEGDAHRHNVICLFDLAAYRGYFVGIEESALVRSRKRCSVIEIRN